MPRTDISERGLEALIVAKPSILTLYDRLKREVPRIIPSKHELRTLDALFGRPIFSASDFIEQSGIPITSAYAILSALKKHQVNAELSGGAGRRAATFLFTELLSITES